MMKITNEIFQVGGGALDLLLSLEADILCKGHYGIYKGKNEVRKFIKSFL